MKQTTSLILLISSASLLAACASAKEKLGVGRNTPDEFAVIKRAPLEIPPDLRALPVPKIGAPRPQEDTTQETAQKALFGDDSVDNQQTISQSENALLSKVGAENAKADIRNIIDQETEEYAQGEQAVIDKLLKRKKTVPGSTLDAREELERLKGQSVPTPNVPPPAEKE